MIGRFFTYCGVVLLAFAIMAIGALGFVHLGSMLDVADTAPYAKGVLIAGAVGTTAIALAGWLDSRQE